jgi:hypothetical protein
MPALVLTVAAGLFEGGRQGLWLALLFAAAPLAAFLLVSRGGAGASAGALPLAAMLLVVALMLAANLSLAGNVSAWMGLPRWTGVLAGAGASLGALLWSRASRSWPWLFPLGVAGLLLPLGVMVHASGSPPPAVWRQITSEGAFRFRSDSPWVTEGRAVVPRRGPPTLRFEEEHRVTAVDPGPIRLEIADRDRIQIQERTLSSGQAVTLRPGDRLHLDPGRRLQFEAGKRIPGTPASGIAWADPPSGSLRLALGDYLGLAVTLLGGAVSFAGFGHPAPGGRFAAGVWGLVLLALLGWAECWAIYAVRWAPELFMGGVDAPALLELPAVMLRGDPWGLRLAVVTVLGLFLAFLAGCLALREGLGATAPERGPVLASEPGLWAALIVVTALGSLWLVEPLVLTLIAFGAGASALSPLALLPPPPGRPSHASWVVGVGLFLFLAAAAVGWVGPADSAVVRAIGAYPALAAAPVTASALWVARRLVGP